MKQEHAEALAEWAFNATDHALRKALRTTSRPDRFAVLHAEWRARGYDPLPWPKR